MRAVFGRCEKRVRHQAARRKGVGAQRNRLGMLYVLRGIAHAREADGVGRIRGMRNVQQDENREKCVEKTHVAMLPGGRFVLLILPIAAWYGNRFLMNIVVVVKLVPDTNADKRIDPATKRLVRTGVEIVINPFDEYAIEAALQLKEKLGGDTTVTICTMAPESGKETVRKALAMGADAAVIVSNPALEGSDAGGTARVLAAAIKKIGFHLVVCGMQSTDAITGIVPGMLAEYLGVPGLTYARKIELEAATLRAERETDTGFQRVSVQLPALVSVTKAINEPRYPSLKGIMGAKKKTITVFALADLTLDHLVGGDGARTEVLTLAAPPARAKGHVVSVADGDEGANVVVAFLQEKKLL
jgi:electron transfer flavoprotein beta subunit